MRFKQVETTKDLRQEFFNFTPMGLTLNVGCGDDTWGDVRIDASYRFIVVNNKPTVLADAHYLPFRNDVFYKSKMNHVLEHLSYPYKALDEIIRVTNKELYVAFPSEHDIKPFFLSNIMPIPYFKGLRMAAETRQKRLHLWIIKPDIIIDYLRKKGWISQCSKGTLCVFRFLEVIVFFQRKPSKFLLWIIQRARILNEYIIVSKKRLR